MIRLLPLAAAIALAATASAQDLEPELPGAAQFEAGSGRIWFSHCAYQAERYMVCKNAARPILDAIAKPADGGHPGNVLQATMRKLFEEKGCTFEAAPETFGVNGIFLSFDAEKGRDIRCEDKASKLVFAPGVITFLDTLYFLSGDPPQ